MRFAAGPVFAVAEMHMQLLENKDSVPDIQLVAGMGSGSGNSGFGKAVVGMSVADSHIDLDKELAAGRHWGPDMGRVGLVRKGLDKDTVVAPHMDPDSSTAASVDRNSRDRAFADSWVPLFRKMPTELFQILGSYPSRNISCQLMKH